LPEAGDAFAILSRRNLRRRFSGVAAAAPQAFAQDIFVTPIAKRSPPTKSSGTGKDVTRTDEYWYSEDLRINLMIKHSAPP
jgi:hypothetical protein